MHPAESRLISEVQYNCDVSDARFAGNYTMCVYLLKMREYYRWRHGFGFAENLSMSDVGEWVQQTESLWETLEDRQHTPLIVDGTSCDVFDDERINQRLPDRCLFSSGIGRFGKPVFVLAELVDVRHVDGMTVHIAGREFARELSAPPAMIRQNRLFIRRESLERMLWETVEEWRWHRRPGPMANVVAHYDFDRDESKALSDLLNDQLEQMLLHEVGEFRAGQLLGDDWDKLILEHAGSQVETIARAIRDCLADCLEVIPQLAESSRRELLDFYIAVLTPLRREMFPSIIKAYHQWLDDGSLGSIIDVAENGRQHFESLARELLELHRNGLLSDALYMPHFRQQAL
ncbi:MAG: hypothetical protein DHS20C01_19470 [marine bacterium B5-7]|nr:MAG: hypothetical protein DHS20C01_19470 [marine bacterium B5-7]